METVTMTVLQAGPRVQEILGCLERERGLRVTGKDLDRGLAPNQEILIEADHRRLVAALDACAVDWPDHLAAS